MFEWHITCPIEQADSVEKITVGERYKFSKIDGDPVLGNMPFCYASGHTKSLVESFTQVEVFGDLLEGAGVNVLRRKIELIVYDTKTGIGIA